MIDKWDKINNLKNNVCKYIHDWINLLLSGLHADIFIY